MADSPEVFRRHSHRGHCPCAKHASGHGGHVLSPRALGGLRPWSHATPPSTSILAHGRTGARHRTADRPRQRTRSLQSPLHRRHWEFFVSLGHRAGKGWKRHCRTCSAGGGRAHRNQDGPAALARAAAFFGERVNRLPRTPPFVGNLRIGIPGSDRIVNTLLQHTLHYHSESPRCPPLLCWWSLFYIPFGPSHPTRRNIDIDIVTFTPRPNSQQRRH